jgi:methylated-DNA-[protein]-cysteine S-methyltransferase
MIKDFAAMREVQAPAGFVANVLRRVGLLDGYAQVATPIGPRFVAASAAGITAVAQAGDDAAFVRYYRERFGRTVERRDELAPALQAAIESGKEAAVDLHVCNAFQRDVLEAARSIPAGRVRPYAWIAERIGRPGAVRAVGTALANNPVPLVIPCHRVVRGDGSIGQYALGTDKKATLLEHEGVDLDEVRRRMPTRNVWKEEGEDTFCRPFCFDARPLTPENHVIVFKSAAEARAHGLTPCTTCHPGIAA